MCQIRLPLNHVAKNHNFFELFKAHFLSGLSLVPVCKCQRGFQSHIQTISFHTNLPILDLREFLIFFCFMQRFHNLVFYKQGLNSSFESELELELRQNGKLLELCMQMLRAHCGCFRCIPFLSPQSYTKERKIDINIDKQRVEEIGEINKEREQERKGTPSLYRIHLVVTGTPSYFLAT